MGQLRDELGFEVEDTGSGVGPEDLTRIFESFEQSESGAHAGGAGLGLSIGRELARLMGGDIKVASAKGHGSTFTFSFRAIPGCPVTTRTRQTGARAIRLAPPEPAPRVLIADDQPENRNLLDELLQQLGYDTRAVPTGEDAIAMHASWGPHLILMDLQMPGMGGLEAIRAIRAADSSTVIVALTASGLSEAREAALTAGANELIWKPFREADLLESIGALLGLSYEYERPTEHSEQSRSRTDPTRSLSDLLSEVPEELRQTLHAAVLGARTEQLETLVERLHAHSPAVAERVEMAIADYHYDSLLEALASFGRPPSSPSH